MSDSIADRPIIIQKYGGSSVATLEKLENIARCVVARHSQGYGVVVVVSAMGNTTDELLKMASRIMPDPPARELDMLLSTGERTTMSLLSIAIQKYGAEAISFTGSQAGIITTDSHSNARIISVRPYRVQDELARDRIVIVAGFQGTSYKNEITTLGRGGSDMTAIALAGALSAEACEIYSDVDGVYTADPKVVLDARKLDELSSSEMLEMAQHGAKVLHDEAILYAHRHQIALYAKKSHDSSSTGSYIRPDGWPDNVIRQARNHPTAVVTAKKTIFVSVRTTEIGKWLEQLASAETIKVMGMSIAGDRIDALLDIWNCPDESAICSQLLQEGEVEGNVRTDIQNVTVTGLDIGRHPDIIQKLHEALAAAQIPVIAQFVEANAISFVIDKLHNAQASQVLHAFVMS